MTATRMLAGILALLLGSSCFAAVTGTTTDTDGRPLADCELESGANTTVTGSDGSFRLEAGSELEVACRG